MVVTVIILVHVTRKRAEERVKRNALDYTLRSTATELSSTRASATHNKLDEDPLQSSASKKEEKKSVISLEEIPRTPNVGQQRQPFKTKNIKELIAHQFFDSETEI